MQTFSTTGSSNRQLKLEILLFRLGKNFYASRTNTVVSLADLPKNLEREQQLAEWLSPRLFAAFVGKVAANHLYIFSLDRLLQSPLISETEAMPNNQNNDEKASRVILLNRAGVKIGLLVDEIIEVRSVEIAQLKPMPEFVEQVRQRKAPWALLQPDAKPEMAQAEIDEEWIIVLDLPGLLNEAEWLLLDNLDKVEPETAI